MNANDLRAIAKPGEGPALVATADQKERVGVLIDQLAERPPPPIEDLRADLEDFVARSEFVLVGTIVRMREAAVAARVQGQHLVDPALLLGKLARCVVNEDWVFDFIRALGFDPNDDGEGESMFNHFGAGFHAIWALLHDEQKLQLTAHVLRPTIGDVGADESLACDQRLIDRWHDSIQERDDLRRENRDLHAQLEAIRQRNRDAIGGGG